MGKSSVILIQMTIHSISFSISSKVIIINKGYYEIFKTILILMKALSLESNFNEENRPFLFVLLVNITYGLALIPLLGGSIILLMLIFSGYYVDYTVQFFEGKLFLQNLDVELTNIGPIFYIIGNFMFFFGVISLVGNYFLDKLNPVGWLTIISVYLFGTLFSAYIVINKFLAHGLRFSSALLYGGIFVLGIISLHILIFHKRAWIRIFSDKYQH